ncbi:MAG: LLM class flavin-dependent oxidoreductase [Steroidobacteraceae bacterium]
MKFTIGMVANGAITQAVEWAKVVEDFGFDKLGYTEDMMYKSGWPSLFLASQVTKRIKLGVTLSNPNTTHPAILATYAAMLDEASNGRAFLCLGRGHLQVLKSQLNVVPEKPLTALREAVQYCKRLWRKDPTPFEGEVFYGSSEAVFNFDPIRSEIPVLVGAWGPKAVRMSGAEADGVLAYGVWNNDYIRRMQQQVQAGAGEKGRNLQGFAIDVEPVFHIAEDGNEAKEKAREMLAMFINILTPITDIIDPELFGRICSAIERQETEKAKSLISDELLDEFALYGTPAQIIEKIERKAAEVGLREMSFDMPFAPDDIDQYIQLLGRKVIPHFRKKE